MVVDQARRPRPLRRRRALLYLDARQLGPVRPERLERDPPGRGHRLLRLHRLRRGLARRPRRPKDPQRNMPRGHHRLARHLHAHLRRGRRGGHRDRALPAAEGLAEPLARAFDDRRAAAGRQGSSRSAPSSAITAVLLVFQLGQPRIFFSMSRDGLLPPVVRRASTRASSTPHVTTILTGVVVALAAAFLDVDEIVRPHQHRHPLRLPPRLRRRPRAARPGPDRPRPFRVPFVWVVAPLGAPPAST